MKTKPFLYIIIFSVLLSCSGKESSFLYKGHFFKKGIKGANEPYQLTTDISSEFYPTVSKDGKYIIYVSDKSGNLDLWLYEILSRNSYRITYHSSDDTMPSFSENGKEVIFISFRRSGQGDLFKLDFDDILERSQSGLSEDYKKELLKDDEAEPLSENMVYESEPIYIDNKYLFCVQPDKKWINNIFKRKDKLNADTQQITTKGAISPTVSPNEQYMAYIDVSENPVHKGHLFIHDFNTEKRWQITKGESIDSRPQFINNYVIIFSSIRFDSNKNKKIDLSDNSSIFLYNIQTKKIKQLTPDNYTDHYPVYSPIYNGVLIYTSNIQDNIDLWMLPLEGILPELETPFKQEDLVDSLENRYIQLLGYENLLNRHPNKNRIYIKLSQIYRTLDNPQLAETYLNKIIESAPQTPEAVRAKINLIENKYPNSQHRIKKLLILHNSIKTNRTLFKEKHLINYRLSIIYNRDKKYKKAIDHLERIAQSYTNKDQFLFRSLQELMHLYVRFNNIKLAEKKVKQIHKFNNFDKIINFQNKFLILYARFNPSKNKKETYKKLLAKQKDKDIYYYNILYHHALSQVNKKKAIELHSQIANDAPHPYLKIKALAQLYYFTGNQEYIYTILKSKQYDNKEITLLLDNLRNKMVNQFLKQGKIYFNKNDFLTARQKYHKAFEIINDNIGALTGSLRCDFKLLKPDEKRYKKMISRYDELLQKDPSNYVYHYLKGYAFTLIYSYYFIQYKNSLKEGEPSIFTKFIDLFRSNNPYPSTYRDKLDKYFELSINSIKITYRLKPDFVPAYLTAGWLHQIHSDIDKENLVTYIENAIPLYQSAIHFNDETSDPQQESALCMNLANLYFNLKNFSQAFQFYHKKLQFDTSFDNKYQTAYFYYHLGYTGWFLEKDKSAIESFQKAYTNFMQLKEYEGAFRSLTFLGMIHRINKDYKKTLYYYNQAVKLIATHDLSINEERLIREMGICHKNLQNFKTALAYFKEAEEIIPKDDKASWWDRPAIRVGILDYTVPVWGQNITLGQSFAHHGFRNRDEQKLIYSLIKETYEQFLNYPKAIKYLLLKKELLEEDDNYDAIPYVYNNLAYLYFKLNNYSKAKEYYSQSIELLEDDTKKNKEGDKIPKDIKGIIINSLNLAEVLLSENKNKPVHQYMNSLQSILKKTSEWVKKGKKLEKYLIQINNLYGLLYFRKALKNTENKKINSQNVHIVLKENNKDFITALKYFRKASQIAKKNKKMKDLLYINFNIGLIYYYTQDFSSAFDIFSQLNRDAKKYFLSVLRWKTEYYLLKINQLIKIKKNINILSYPHIIKLIEEDPKGYNYTPLEEDLIYQIYDETIQQILLKKDYTKALLWIEKKKNFKIRELFRSYPFKLKPKDDTAITRIKDLEQQYIHLKKEAQHALLKKFNAKKRTWYSEKLIKIDKQRKDYIKTLYNKRSQLLYYIYKWELPIAQSINNLSTNNAVLIFHINENNLNIGIITDNHIDFKKIKIDPHRLNKNCGLLHERLAENEDISQLKTYFNNLLFNKIKTILKNKEIITIIPDSSLFKIPFHLFLDNDIHYDISLTQFFFNIEKIPLVYNKMSIINSDSRLYDINYPINSFQDDNVPVSVIRKLYQTSSSFHIPDGIQYNVSNPINYKLNYNEDYSLSIMNLIDTVFKGEMISFDKTAENFNYSEKNIISLLLPIYYSGASTVALNLWDVKEKINYKFWQYFYNQNETQIIKKYRKALKKNYSDYGDYNRSYFKILYGNFGTDKNYKTDILIQKNNNLMQTAEEVTNLQEKIDNYEGSLTLSKELRSLKTNYQYPEKQIHQNLFSLYIKNNQLRNAANHLKELITLETNRKKRRNLNNKYTQIKNQMQRTNNDIEKLNTLIKTGDQYFTEQKYDDASESYIKAVNYLENSTLEVQKNKIIYKVGNSLIHDNNLEEAETWLKRGLKSSTNKQLSENDNLYLLLAKIMHINENYYETLNYLDQIIKRNEKYYVLKINALLKSDYPDSMKLNQINLVLKKKKINYTLPSLKKLYNPIIDYYQDRNRDIYSYIYHYKQEQNNTKIAFTNIQNQINTNTLFIDFYVSNESIYSFLIKNKKIKTIKLELDKYSSLYNKYQQSIDKNNNDEFKENSYDLFKYLFEESIEDIKRSSNIIIYPDESLFSINYYNYSDNIFSYSNQNIKIIKSYDSLYKRKKTPFVIHGYGIQKNLPGRIIMDFSYKEVQAIKKYFKNSQISINPTKINFKKNINTIHLAIPVIRNNTNVLINDENSEKNYDLFNTLPNKELKFLLLSKLNHQDELYKILYKINAQNMLISLWRKNDAKSAIFLHSFYRHLAGEYSIERAYKRALLKMKKDYKNQLDWNGFLLIQ